MFENGEGILLDIKKASFYYKKACELGFEGGCKAYDKLN
ncbi:MAG: SEL1-like repeat protein [Campylobacteraceae bacterium]|nr:SEL1-like repeat protein [Campylobacteraceae bacterium]